MSQRIVILLISIYFATITSKQLSKRSILDNEINANALNLEENLDQSWVTINAKAKDIEATPGEVIELECEASGSPQPIIQFYNRVSVLSNNEIISNEISGLSQSGLIKAIGRLRLVAEKSEVIFCKATSGSKTAHAAIKIFVSPSKMNFLSNDIFETPEIPASVYKIPRIAFYDTMYLETIGNTVILPCSSMGATGSDTIWLNGNEKVIGNARGERFTVTSFGHLKIKNIEWSDMGAYTCIVRNNFGKDSITTFLYPMLAEK